jgi:hypothetical protein
MRRTWTWILVALLTGGSVAAAQVRDARRAQVDAAVFNAVEGLYREVTRSPVTGAVTVGELVERVGGRAELIRALQGAQEIGGPRWLDDQTAQVRLEISGSRVRQVVLQMAASNPRKTPVNADALAALLADWDRKTFGAVGTSTGAAGVVELRPTAEDPAWAGVPEQARRDAIAAARTDAGRRVIDGVRQVELKQGVTVGQVMERAGSPVAGALDRYLADRPVTGVQFRQDRQVEVGLSVPGEELAGVIRGAVEGMKDPQLAAVDWNGVTGQIVRAVGQGTGVATAGGAVRREPDAGVAQVAPSATVRIPAEPPEWVWRQVDADASAKGGESALKCARAAERAAGEKLRAQVDALPLGGMTIGEAGTRDPRVADAVGRGVARARVYKSDYQADGTATVYVSLELRDVWEQLRQL